MSTKSIDKVSRYFWYRDTKKYRGLRDTSIVKFWYRDISKYRQYRPSLYYTSICLSFNDNGRHCSTVCVTYCLSLSMYCSRCTHGLRSHFTQNSPYRNVWLCIVPDPYIFSRARFHIPTVIHLYILSIPVARNTISAAKLWDISNLHI